MKTTAFTSWLLIFAACLFFSLYAAASTQTDIIGLAGSEQVSTMMSYGFAEWEFCRDRSVL